MTYDAYLQTPEWRSRREWALERAGHRCQVCNGDDALQVHHRSYENLGAELPGDLIVLCDDCHGLFHRMGRLHSIPPAVREGIVQAIDALGRRAPGELPAWWEGTAIEGKMRALRRRLSTTDDHDEQIEILAEMEKLRLDYRRATAA